MNDGKIIIDKIIADADEALKKIISEAKEAADTQSVRLKIKQPRKNSKPTNPVAEEKKRQPQNRFRELRCRQRKRFLQRNRLYLKKL